jgi:hypothetical protein
MPGADMRTRAPAALLLLALGAAPAAASASAGFVPEALVRARARDYLRFATRETARGSVLNAIAHMERDATDPGYRAPRAAVDVADWNAIWSKLDRLEDTRDFDGLYLLNALLGYEGHPYLTPALWERIRVALLSFKMWFTDPTPPQPDPAQPERDWDDSFYWTENHQALYHVIEYLAGQRFPDECFWIVGFERTPDCTGPGELRGAEHVTRARGFLLRWMDERWEAGFSEWLSNVYYQKDATPLLTLVEYAEDPEIATRAAILLDALLLDLATHLHGNAFAATRGRSYMKDKYRGPEDDTWGLSVLLFGRRGATGFTSVGDPGATLFARARRYRLPAAIHEAARARRPHAVRTRQGFPLDPSAPLGPDPEHPPGHSFEDSEANFTFWWGLGAYTAWQVVPLTVLNGDRWNLWNTDLLRGFRSLRDILGDPPDLGFGQWFASLIAPLVNAGLLTEANTYTWRTPDYVLSTVQDHRRGENAGQVHAWQATFDEDALVFTTHAMNPVQPPSEWIGRDEGSPGYWTGTASMPRSAQHENVAIHLYSPAYADGGLLGFFDYEQTTHAFFPQDQFDEVVQLRSSSTGTLWTFGRKGKGYVALWSWQDTVWKDYPPDELARPANGPLTRSFDLVAPGGASNVWIVECGRRADWGSFRSFVDAIVAARVEVVAEPAEFGFAFDVLYDSPSQGLVSFGWDEPLVVRGEMVPLAGYPRAESPWLAAGRGDRAWSIEGRRGRVRLDWDAPSREVVGRRAGGAGGKGAGTPR